MRKWLPVSFNWLELWQFAIPTTRAHSLEASLALTRVNCLRNGQVSILLNHASSNLPQMHRIWATDGSHYSLGCRKLGPVELQSSRICLCCPQLVEERTALDTRQKLVDSFVISIFRKQDCFTTFKRVGERTIV